MEGGGGVGVGGHGLPGPPSVAAPNKPKPYIDKNLLLSLYHPYIHSYINYENIALGSTTRTLKKYTVNTNMLSELYIVKIDSHILENSLRSIKFLIVNI